MSHDSTDPPLVAAAVARARRAGFPMSCDPAVGRLLAVLAAQLPDRARVLERHADALDVLARSGTFDLIFADAPDGKWHKLDSTIAALGPHGLLVVDDMTPLPDWTAGHRAAQAEVRRALLTAPGLTSVELAHGSGMILGARGS